MVFFKLDTLDTILTSEVGIALMGAEETHKTSLLLQSVNEMVSDRNISNIIPVINENAPNQDNLVTIAVVVDKMTAQEAVLATFHGKSVLTISSDSINTRYHMHKEDIPVRWKSQATVIVNSCKVVFIEPLETVGLDDVLEYLDEIKFNNENLHAVVIDKLCCDVKERESFMEYTTENDLVLLLSTDVRPSTEEISRAILKGWCRIFYVQKDSRRPIDRPVVEVSSIIYDTALTKRTTIEFDHMGSVVSSSNLN